MLRAVQILGVGPNLSSAPLLPGVERWCMNYHRIYRLKYPEALETWTRWFNVHSHAHMVKTYPDGFAWYTQQTKPIYFAHEEPEVPSAVLFPYRQIQTHFQHSPTEPETFFTLSLAWLMAFAIMEGFERIELWGHSLTERDMDTRRPAIHYWIGRARQAGITVYIPPDVDTCRADRLYGIETS